MDSVSEPTSITESYADMAADQLREQEAAEWSEALISDPFMHGPN